MNRRQFLQSTLATLVAPTLPVASRHIIAEFPNLTYVESQWAKDFEWKTLDDAIVKAGSKRINELLGKARA